MLTGGQCIGLDLARLVGRWTWACLACRPALAVFSAVYRFIECAGSKRFVLWRSATRELRVLMGLAPLLFSCTSAPWFDRVVATDASSAGGGGQVRCRRLRDVCRAGRRPGRVRRLARDRVRKKKKII